MALRIVRKGHLCRWPDEAITLYGHGAGDPVPRLRRSPARLFHLRRRATAARRPALGLAPRRGVGRPRPAAVLPRARAHAPGRPLRPARLRAQRPAARAAADGRVREPPARGGDRRRRRPRRDLRVVVLLPRRVAARDARPAGRSSGSSSSARYAKSQRHPRGDARPRSLQFTRINWGLAAQMFASLFDPHAGGDELQKYTRMQRKAATAEAASIFLELDLNADLRDVAAQVAVPALVLHRRGDRTVPISRGRELASLLPNARFVRSPARRTCRGKTTSASCFARSPAFSTTRRRRTSRPARRSPHARPRCCGSSRPACRTARSPRRSCSVSTPSIVTSRTSSAGSHSRRVSARRRTRHG